MYLFLLTFIPLSILFFTHIGSSNSWKNFIPQMIFALVIASAVCCIKEFFIFSFYIKTDSFIKNCLHVFFKDSALPFIALGICHLLLCKDDFEYKTEAFFVLLASFYALYIPYFVISAMERNSIYYLFFKPIVFAEMSLLISLVIPLFLNKKTTKNTKEIILLSAITMLICLVPAVIENLWYFSILKILWLIVFCIYTYVCGLFFYKKCLQD